MVKRVTNRSAPLPTAKSNAPGQTVFFFIGKQVSSQVMKKLGCPLEITGQMFQTLAIESFTEHVLSTYSILGVVLGAGD